ncbi:MAG: pilus assembly protein [Proteobacteria bacterium]|nr:pilus assembly protein [Pseudomonadota bacterium]
MQKTPSLISNKRGQGLAEYIIIVILVAIIVLVAVKLFGKSVFSQFGSATSEINDLQKPDE